MIDERDDTTSWTWTWTGTCLPACLTQPGGACAVSCPVLSAVFLSFVLCRLSLSLLSLLVVVVVVVLPVFLFAWPVVVVVVVRRRSVTVVVCVCVCVCVWDLLCVLFCFVFTSRSLLFHCTSHCCGSFLFLFDSGDWLL